MKLIIGLGNNDSKYENTYHNVGFLMLDYLATQELNLPLIKTGGFMNEAGKYVKETLKKHKLLPEDLLIIHDDSDIILGEYKISKSRGSAGHKGVQNIIDILGSKNFARLRIGIRPPKNISGHIKAEDFVLKNISKTSLEILNNVFEKAGEELRILL